ncbi:MAG: hypothetical protein AAF335_01450 [Bacteroidota bacterium]
MSSQPYFYLTKMRCNYSPKNEYKITLPYLFPTVLPSPTSIYLYQHHTYVPYKVASWRIVKKNLFLSLTHPHLFAKERSTYPLFLSWPWLKKVLKKHPSLDNLVFSTDFLAIDSSGQSLGTIAGIQQRIMQPLLILYKDEKEIQIPVHEKFIGNIDFDKQVVHIQDTYHYNKPLQY